MIDKVLGFNRFLKNRLQESFGISEVEKDNIRTIIQKLVDGNASWLKGKNILVGDKGDYWILNYGIEDKNEFNKLVRGLVVKKPNHDFSGDFLNLIKSFPFTRFFNKGEQHADSVDFNNSEMIEKLDGTFVGVFFPNKDPKDPHWHTRKMISSHKPDIELTTGGFAGGQHKLMEIIGNYVKQLNYDDEDVHFTYLFEFIHHASAVLTKYSEDQYGLYLLAARDLRTHLEKSENELDKIAKKIGVRRPSRWDSVADSNQIGNMMKELSSKIKDFEGFVFRDKQTGKRLKVKDPKYVEKHHKIGDLSPSKLIPKILEGEENEVIAYFPHIEYLVQEIKRKHNNLKSEIVDLVNHFKKNVFTNRKDLWFKVDKQIEEPFIKNCIMKHINSDNLDEDIDKELRSIAINSYQIDGYAGKSEIKKASEKYLKLLGFKD
jgi:hypothetical protein